MLQIREGEWSREWLRRCACDKVKKRGAIDETEVLAKRERERGVEVITYKGRFYVIKRRICREE